jgi:hypothetical protein
MYNTKWFIAIAMVFCLVLRYGKYQLPCRWSCRKEVHSSKNTKECTKPDSLLTKYCIIWSMCWEQKFWNHCMNNIRIPFWTFEWRGKRVLFISNSICHRWIEQSAVDFVLWTNICCTTVAPGFPVYEHVWLLFFRQLVIEVCIILSFIYLTTLLQVHRMYSINEFYRNKLYLFVSFRNQYPRCYKNQDRIQFLSQNSICN